MLGRMPRFSLLANLVNKQDESRRIIPIRTRRRRFPLSSLPSLVVSYSPLYPENERFASFRTLP